MVEEPADFGDVTEGLRRGCSQGGGFPHTKNWEANVQRNSAGKTIFLVGGQCQRSAL